jgi:hypothetical protein
MGGGVGGLILFRAGSRTAACACCGIYPGFFGTDFLFWDYLLNRDEGV